MSVNPVRIAIVCILMVLLAGPALAQSQAAAEDDSNPSTWPYKQWAPARAFGNVGGWWSYLNENEKDAFLDGYREAMEQSRAQFDVACKTLKKGVKPSSDQDAFMSHFAAVVFVCERAHELEGFEKVTAKDLDDFYSDPVNQPMLLPWTMRYLRDKADGRKTKGQLLDELEAEQKDVHDCTKYPNLCKLGVKDSKPAQ